MFPEVPVGTCAIQISTGRVLLKYQLMAHRVALTPPMVTDVTGVAVVRLDVSETMMQRSLLAVPNDTPLYV